MNCSRCNAPLVEGARFCRNCGQPIQSAPLNPAGAADYQGTVTNSASGQPYTPAAQGNIPPYAPTQAVSPISPLPAVQTPGSAFPQQYPGQFAQPIQPLQPTQQAQQFQQGQQAQAGQFAQQVKPFAPGARKRRWPLRLAITLIVLVVLVVGGWFLVARPIIHSYAQSQLDQVITSQVNLIPPAPPLVNSLPPVSETVLNNLIVLNLSPGDPVQNPVIHISPPVFASDGSYSGGVQLTFQLDGFPCSVTAIPQASNGNIILTHMQISGIISWVISPDELTSDLNTHFQDVDSHLGRPISSVTINNQEIDITLA